MSRASAPVVCALSASREDLIAFLSAAARVAANGKPIPCLSSAYIWAHADRVDWWVTDTEVWRGGQMPATVETAGEALIPVAQVLAMVKQCADGPVYLSVRGTDLTVTAGHFKANVPLFSLDDYPARPSDGSGGISVPALLLARALKLAVVATHETSGQTYMRGVQLLMGDKTLSAAAIDGHRLARATVTLPDEIGSDGSELTALLPKRSVAELVALLSSCDAAELATYRALDGGQKHAFVVGTDVIISREIDAQFPAVGKMLRHVANPKTTVDCDRQSLERAVARVQLATTEAALFVKLEITSKGIELTASSAQKGSTEDRVPCSVKGDPMTVSLNGRYLREVLDVIDSDQVTLELTSDIMPVVFRPATSDLDYVHLIQGSRP